MSILLATHTTPNTRTHFEVCNEPLRHTNFIDPYPDPLIPRPALAINDAIGLLMPLQFSVMSENPFEAIRKACNALGHCFHTHLSRICPAPPGENTHSIVAGNSATSLFSFFDAAKPRALDDATQIKPKENIFEGKITTPPLTKEELGRSTWTLLHTVAAQFPDHPTRQQKRDVKELMALLSRLYPCKECANHFKEVLKANPVQAGSQAEFSQWLCHVHNIVNRSLGKRTFPCQRVTARWGKLDCPDHSCDVEGNTSLSFPSLN